MARRTLQEYRTIRNNAMKDLPSTVETKRDLTYTVPNILLKYEDVNGVPTMQIRMGSPKQIEHVVTINFVEDAIDEQDQVFTIKARNRINVGNMILDVLNDRIEGSKPIAPSAPTATEYIGKVGKSVLTFFSCKPDPIMSKTLEREVFKVVRSKIILP